MKIFRISDDKILRTEHDWTDVVSIERLTLEYVGNSIASKPMVEIDNKMHYSSKMTWKKKSRDESGKEFIKIDNKIIYLDEFQEYTRPSSERYALEFTVYHLLGREVGLDEEENWSNKTIAIIEKLSREELLEIIMEKRLD